MLLSPPGIVFPDGIVFAATLIAKEMPYEPVRIWYKGMRYPGINNDSKSLHIHDGMFHWAELSVHDSIPDTTMLATKEWTEPAKATLPG